MYSYVLKFKVTGTFPGLPMLSINHCRQTHIDPYRKLSAVMRLSVQIDICGVCHGMSTFAVCAETEKCRGNLHQRNEGSLPVGFR